MTVNSRAKGARLERQIATDLRAWLGEDWRVTRNPTMVQCGQDGVSAGEYTITGPHVFPFVVEVKADGGFDERQLFKLPVTGPLQSFWWQAIHQADAVNQGHRSRLIVDGEVDAMQPLLIARRSRGTTLAFMRWRMSLALMDGPHQQRHVMQLHLPDRTHVGRVAVWRWQDLLAVDSLRLLEVVL